MNNKFILIGIGILAIALVFVVLPGRVPKQNATGDGVSDPVERLYNLDPQRQFIGANVDNVELRDIITGKNVNLDDFSDKVVVIESFSVGCPACAEGIKLFSQIYDKYGSNVVIVYVDINPADTEQDILNIKRKYDGKDWVWIKYASELQGFLSKYGIEGNDITYIIKNNKIEYADSLSAPFSRIDKAVGSLI